MKEYFDEPSLDQWQATINQLNVRFRSLEEATALLDEKGDRLLQISGILVVIIGLFGFGSRVLEWPEIALLVIAAGLFLFVLYLTQLAALPKPYPLPGPISKSNLINDYLDVDENTTYGQISLDLLSVIDDTKEINAGKASHIKSAVHTFGVEVVALVLAAIFNLT